MIGDSFVTPLELKFAENAPEGVFSGYGAVFGNEDSHGDVIVAGAFAESIEERKASRRFVPMHVMHGVLGGDGLPVGVWTSVQEDAHGLRVEGKISGMNTDTGRLLFERVKDGALGGLSIGYRVRANGAMFGKSKGEPRRTLKSLDLREISLVDDPSNALSRVEEIKSLVRDEMKATLALVDRERAVQAVTAAYALHAGCLSGGDAPTLDERKQLLTHLEDVHEALTGTRQPAGVKSTPKTIREFENWLRDELKFSHSQARAIAEHGFKTASTPRDEGDGKADIEAKAALKEIEGAVAGFSLPRF